MEKLVELLRGEFGTDNFDATDVLCRADKNVELYRVLAENVARHPRQKSEQSKVTAKKIRALLSSLDGDAILILRLGQFRIC